VGYFLKEGYMIDIKELSKITEFVKSLYPSYMRVDINVRGAFGALKMLERELDEISIPITEYLYDYILAMLSANTLWEELRIMNGERYFITDDNVVVEDVHGVKLTVDWYKYAGQKADHLNVREIFSRLLNSVFGLKIENWRNRIIMVDDNNNDVLEIKSDEKFVYVRIFKRKDEIVKFLEDFYNKMQDRIKTDK
jgi:hypothetical protein